jgi:glycosyltransferase involved in cell wall biosynthesis
MRISVIMPAHNAERYVASALDSVLTQTLPPHEIIVVDDGSTDGTSGVLETYVPRIRLIRQRNSGPGAAINRAVALAEGDSLAFIDADDLWVPEKLEIQAAALSADADLEAVFGAIQQFVSNELDWETARDYLMPDGVQPGISKITMLIRRAAFARVGPFAEQYRAAEFIEWYARACVLGLRFRVLSEVVALRRQHPQNLGRRGRAARAPPGSIVHRAHEVRVQGADHRAAFEDHGGCLSRRKRVERLHAERG